MYEDRLDRRILLDDLLDLLGQLLHRSNDVSCRPWTCPKMKPVSCCGKNPFGIAT